MNKKEKFYMVNYAVSDMMTRLRNGIRGKKAKVAVIKTNLTKNIAEILQREGFIDEIGSSPVLSLDSGNGFKPQSLKSQKNIPTFDIYLKYKISPGQKPQSVVTNLKCITRPGVRIYANSKQIPQVLGGLGVTILSTSKGILTDAQARKLGVGGEILCMLW
jgi:small subunit ribosomal protein S8